MLPDGVLSSQWFKAPYLKPDDIKDSKLVDYELGGIGLNDPSQGLRVQTWKCEVIGGTRVYVSAPNTPRILLFERPSVITEVSLAFDQNMNTNIAFVEAEQAKFWWYDTVAQGQVFLDLHENDKTPRICMDDKRRLESSTSDVILGYVRDNNLYVRIQRDRYTIEYLLYTGINGTLEKIGMNELRRLQFQLRSTLF